MGKKSVGKLGSSWESGVSSRAFFVRSIPSMIFRMGYFAFSLYWLYRWEYLSATFLFLILGLLFFFSSAYLLFYPLYAARKQRYSVEGDMLRVPGFLGKEISIPLSRIKSLNDISSGIDRKEGCRSVEIEYILPSGEVSYYEIISAVDFRKAEDTILSAMGSSPKPAEQDRGIRGTERENYEDRNADNKREEIKKDNFTGFFSTRLFILAGGIIIIFLLLYAGVLVSKSYGGYNAPGDISSTASSTFLLAKLSKQINEPNVQVGTFNGDSSSCCANTPQGHNAQYLEIRYTYFGNNMTIYLVDVFTHKPLYNLSHEYIKEVYLCVYSGEAADTNARQFFGESNMSVSTCRWRWEEDSCCMPWHSP